MTVVGKSWIYFNTDKTIATVGRVIQALKHISSAIDVCNHHLPICINGRCTFRQFFSKLFVVITTALNGLLKNCWIRCEATHATFHQVCKNTRGEIPTLQVVQPRTLNLLAIEPPQKFGHLFTASRATRATLSGVIPYFCITTFPGALAPNVSMPTEWLA